MYLNFYILPQILRFTTLNFICTNDWILTDVLLKTRQLKFLKNAVFLDPKPSLFCTNSRHAGLSSFLHQHVNLPDGHVTQEASSSTGPLWLGVAIFPRKDHVTCHAASTPGNADFNRGFCASRRIRRKNLLGVWRMRSIHKLTGRIRQLYMLWWIEI